MELKINNTKAFKNVIRNIFNVIDGSSIRPVLDCFYFMIEESDFKIIAANDTISIRKQINPSMYTLDGSASFIVSAKIFDNIVSNVKDDELVMKLTEDNSLFIKSSNSEYFVSLFNEEEYPLINFSHTNDNVFKVKSDYLINAIKKTVYAAAEKDQRIILNGINIKAKDNLLIFTSTDSYRIARFTSEIKTEIDISETIHIKAMKEIYKLIPDNSELNVSISSDWLFIENQGTVIKSKVIDGIFPNVDRVYPTELLNTLKINKAELVGVIDSALAINNLSDEIHVSISNNQLKIKNAELQIGNAEIVTDNFDYSGATAVISFAVNPRYFLDAIKSFDANVVKIQINESSKPIVISSDEQTNIYNLVQPLKI